MILLWIYSFGFDQKEMHVYYNEIDHLAEEFLIMFLWNWLKDTSKTDNQIRLWHFSNNLRCIKTGLWLRQRLCYAIIIV